MTDETIIQIYNALVICFLVSLVFAVLVVGNTILARRAARKRSPDPLLARRKMNPGGLRRSRRRHLIHNLSVRRLHRRNDPLRPQAGVTAEGIVNDDVEGEDDAKRAHLDEQHLHGIA